MVLMSDNFIDFESVNEVESTLRKIPNIAFWDRIQSIKQPGRHYTKFLREHRAKLYDDRLNFMGLGSTKELEYLNVEDETRVFNNDFS